VVSATDSLQPYSRFSRPEALVSLEMCMLRNYKLVIMKVKFCECLGLTSTIERKCFFLQLHACKFLKNCHAPDMWQSHSWRGKPNTMTGVTSIIKISSFIRLLMYSAATQLLYRLSDRRLSAKLVPAFVNKVMLRSQRGGSLRL
jgi:hypothetical protein